MQVRYLKMSRTFNMFLHNPVVDILQYHVILSKKAEKARLWVAVCNVDDECGVAVAALIGLYSMASSHQHPAPACTLCWVLYYCPAQSPPLIWLKLQTVETRQSSDSTAPSLNCNWKYSQTLELGPHNIHTILLSYSPLSSFAEQKSKSSFFF